MINLILFDFKKFFKNKKNIAGILILFIITLIFFYMNYKLDGQIKESSIGLINEDIESQKQQLMDIERIYKEAENNGEKIRMKKIKSTMLKVNHTIELLSQKRLSVENGNTTEELKVDIQLDENIIDEIKSGDIISSEDENVIENRKNINKILLKDNIEPINTRVSTKSFNLMKLILENIVPLILIITILLISSDAVSNEIESGTFKMILTQSVSRKKVILSKIISYSLIGILITIGLFFIFFIISSFIEGAGSLKYPIEVYSKETNYMEMKNLLIYSVPLLTFIILTTVSMSIFLSTVTGNNLTSISISVIGYVSFFIMNNQLKVLSNISHLIPLTYFDVVNVIDGSLILNHQNINITFRNGLIVLITTVLIINIASVLNFRKKDIL